MTKPFFGLLVSRSAVPIWENTLFSLKTEFVNAERAVNDMIEPRRHRSGEWGRNMKNYMATAASLLASISSVSPASAAVFNFTYNGVSDNETLVQSSGIVTTTDTTTSLNGRQAYTVTGITGSRNGIAITGLAPAFPTIFGGADNYLYASGLPFTDLGVSFSLADSTYANLFLDGTQTGEYFATNVSGTVGRSNALGVFTFSAATAAVPEPATWAMMTLGFGAMGFAMRRKAKVNTRIRFA